MILNKTKVDSISSICGFDVGSIIGLYPEESVTQILNNIEAIDTKYHEQYLKSKALFTPYLIDTDKGPALVVHAQGYIRAIEDGFEYGDTETEAIRRLDVPYLAGRQDSVNLITEVIVDLCKQWPRFYGILNAKRSLLDEFVSKIANQWNLRGTCTLPVECNECVYVPSRRADLNTYTLVANNHVAVGELRCIKDRIALYTKRNDKFYEVSYCVSKSAPREHRRLAIGYLAAISGIYIGDSTIYSVAGPTRWTEQKRIVCYGDYMFS